MHPLFSTLFLLSFHLPCCPQAVRASSAAPYYLDEFNCGEERFQDGAATANNPTLVAIQQVSNRGEHLLCVVLP